jgi:hypothetical protein
MGLAKIRIVFLPASVLFEGPYMCDSTSQNKLKKEVEEINQSLLEAEKETARHIVEYLVLELGKMNRLLLKKPDPRIVHFSDFATRNGNPGSTQIKKLRSEIPKIFKLFGGPIMVVCLNGCYYEDYAEVLVDHVGCVIGSRPGMSYNRSMTFVSSLYENLLFKINVKDAFDSACINLRDFRESVPPEVAPELKPGDKDPMRLILWEELTGAETRPPTEDIATEGFRTISLNNSSPSTHDPNGEDKI